MIGRLKLARIIQKTARSRSYRPSLRLCFRIVSAARDTHTPIPRLAALVEKESAFQFVFGHDAGGPFPGEKVTRAKYRQLVAIVEAGGTSNGVGYVQATYPGFLEQDPALWRPKHNLRWGAKQLDSLVRADGRLAGLNAYNGDPTGAYGRDLSARVDVYAAALRKH